MLRRFLLGTMVMCLASMAWAGVPDPANSSVVMDPGADGANLMVRPDRGGPQYVEAMLNTGSSTPPNVDGTSVEVDATLTVTLIDNLGDPVFLYPFEDLWVETTGSGLAFCAGGTAADQSSDEFGVTTFSNAIAGGGNSFGEFVVVMVAGSPLIQTPDLTFNSPDINGDLVVDLADIVFFVPMLFTATFDGDFNNSDLVNLSDAVFFSQAIGTGCI